MGLDICLLKKATNESILIEWRLNDDLDRRLHSSNDYKVEWVLAAGDELNYIVNHFTNLPFVYNDDAKSSLRNYHIWRNPFATFIVDHLPTKEST